ncbi:MAG: AMP-binding protein, partial [Steroidobacteraceae bacterium]
MSSPPDPDLTRKAVEETVGALYLELHRKTPPAAVLGPRSRLDADLGFDSVARAELLTRVERALQIEIPQATLASIDTLADLLRVASSAPKAATADEAKASRVPRLRRTSQRESAADVLANSITLTDVLAQRAERDPRATHAILLGDAEPRVLTYAELLRGAQAIASGIRALGLGDGATAALMLPTSADYLHAFFGVLLADATPVPLYPPARRSQLEEHVHRHVEILTNAGTQLLITLREARLFARLLRSRVPGLRYVMSVAELAQRGRSDGAANASRADSIALLQYTSGSTGSPKGVILTHEHLLANIRAMGKALAASKDDVMVSWLPLYHDMGLIGAWLGALCFGCPLVLMSPTSFLARPASWLQAIHRYRGTLSGSPNFGYELAIRRIADEDLQGVDLSSLRATFNGAEPVSPDTVERFARRFARYGYRPQAMAPVYGQAEAGVGVTFAPAGRGPLVDRIDRDLLASRGQARSVPADRPGAISFVSCGGPLPGYRLRILDERGSEVPERIEGDLQFAGPSATSGYYRNAEATARLLCGQWRNTGDRAYIAGGELYITGRAKDILIRRGRHIYPEEIESAVGDIEGVRKGRVAAFGTRGEETGTERVVVVAETRETDSARLAALRQHIAERITATIGEPADEIVLVGSHTVLKTSSGKLRRSATHDAYTAGALGHASRKPAVQLLRLALGSAALTANRALQYAVRLAFGAYACSIFIALGTLALALSATDRSANR